LKLNSVPILDLSLTHLSDVTSAWMLRMVEGERNPRLREIGKGPTISIMEREEGFFMSTHHADPEMAGTEVLPRDLLHVLRFARLNGQHYVLFDRDAEPQAGLPVYQWHGEKGADVNRVDPSEPFIGQGRLSPQEIRDPLNAEVSLGTIEGVIPDAVPDGEFTVDPEGITLADGDHQAPDGCWLTVREASVRVGVNDSAVWVEVFAAGDEMGESFGRIEALRSDLSLASEEADQANSPSNGI